MGAIKYVISYIVVVLLIFSAIFIICLPVAYFDGSAKSEYLKQTQGLDLTWYRATWLEVNVSGISATLTHNQKNQYVPTGTTDQAGSIPARLPRSGEGHGSIP